MLVIMEVMMLTQMCRGWWWRGWWWRDKAAMRRGWVVGPAYISRWSVHDSSSKQSGAAVGYGLLVYHACTQPRLDPKLVFSITQAPGSSNPPPPIPGKLGLSVRGENSSGFQLILCSSFF